MSASIAIAATGLLGPVFYFSPWIWRKMSMRMVRQKLRRERTVLLTYDDGPSARLTPRILALLESHQAKATFFMLGQHAKQHADIVSRVVGAGHQVGCHSEAHLNAWRVRPSRAIADIEAGYESLARWIPGNAAFRPPYGKTTLPTCFAVHRRGASLCWWTIDSGDTFKILPHPRQVVERVAREGGGIVLLHDLDRSDDRNEFVIETSAQLLGSGAREGWRFRTVADLQP